MLYRIRAELADGTCRDFNMAGQENEATQKSAARDAQERAEDSLRKEFGADTRLEWRGMVVFVNRTVPLPTPRPTATRGYRRG